MFSILVGVRKKKLPTWTTFKIELNHSGDVFTKKIILIIIIITVIIAFTQEKSLSRVTRIWDLFRLMSYIYDTIYPKCVHRRPTVWRGDNDVNFQFIYAWKLLLIWLKLTTYYFIRGDYVFTTETTRVIIECNDLFNEVRVIEKK